MSCTEGVVCKYNLTADARKKYDTIYSTNTGQTCDLRENAANSLLLHWAVLINYILNQFKYMYVPYRWLNNCIVRSKYLCESTQHAPSPHAKQNKNSLKLEKEIKILYKKLQKLNQTDFYWNRKPVHKCQQYVAVQFS